MVNYKHASISGLAALAALFQTGRAGTTSATAEQIILEIMPRSGACDGTNDQCRTNVQAAPYLVNAFAHYQVYHPAEIAAVLATVATESGDLQFKRNQYPGVPGQGTSNMQMYPFNYRFAQSIPELKDQVDSFATTTLPNEEIVDVKNKVLDLVTADTYNWMTGPWYYSTMCSEDLKRALQTSDAQGLDAAFKAYTTDCIGVRDIEPTRLEAWARAKKAFNL